MENLYIALLALLVAFFVSFAIIPVIIKIVRKKDILDAPGGRKIHKGKIPAFGGVGIFSGFIIGLPFWLPLDTMEQYKFLLAAILLIFFIGVRDDLIPMQPRNKLLGQIIAASIVVVFQDIRLESMHGLFLLQSIPIWVSYILSVFTIIVITNAMNLIDGVDGLAGTVSAITFLVLSTWFYLINEYVLVIICLALFGAILGFLRYNFSPAKIFMGDTGSLLLGFVASVMVIIFIEKNMLLTAKHPSKFNCEVAASISFLIYPLADTLRVFVLRMWKKRSPFSPDKSHIHHLVHRMGMGHRDTTIVLSIIHTIVIFLIVLFRKQNDIIMVPAVIAFCFILGIFLDYRLSKAFPKKTKKVKIFK